jgi:hypothetical protein
MRVLAAISLLFGSLALALGQEGRPKRPDEIPPRYAVAFKGKLYPQSTPREAVQSVLDAVENRDYGYIVAHLLEPGFVDARVSDRAKQAAPTVEANLADLRSFQQANLDRIDRDSRVPVDANLFRARVMRDATTVGFKQLVRDVQDKLTDDPEVLKDLRRIRSGGNFPEDKAAGETAKVGHVDVKDRFLYLKKVGDRWYLENRQTDEKAPEPMPAPEPKKQ